MLSSKIIVYILLGGRMDGSTAGQSNEVNHVIEQWQVGRLERLGLRRQVLVRFDR